MGGNGCPHSQDGRLRSYKGRYTKEYYHFLTEAPSAYIYAHSYSFNSTERIPIEETEYFASLQMCFKSLENYPFSLLYKPWRKDVCWSATLGKQQACSRPSQPCFEVLLKVYADKAYGNRRKSVDVNFAALVLFWEKLIYDVLGDFGRGLLLFRKRKQAKMVHACAEASPNQWNSADNPFWGFHPWKLRTKNQKWALRPKKRGQKKLWISEKRREKAVTRCKFYGLCADSLGGGGGCR